MINRKVASEKLLDPPEILEVIPHANGNTGYVETMGLIVR